MSERAFKLKTAYLSLLGNWRQWTGSFITRFRKPDPAFTEQPLRSELFSAQQMEQYGGMLAKSHKLSDKKTPDHLLKRLADNERVLRSTCTLLIDAVKLNRQITPASEWLLDNFYLIEEQIRTAKRHLPKGYSRGLPRLLKGYMTDLPRVYEIALEIISHGDGRIDPESLSRFIAAYQQGATLKLGELWAVPIMLRLALIENLRRVAVRLASSRVNRDLADFWADQMTASMEKDPTSLILVISDMARSHPPMEGSFVAELVRRLQGHGPALALPLTWIEQRLGQTGSAIEQLIHHEIQQQAADQVTISNSISSLRFLTTMNWRKFVESLSVVEQVLRQDPAGLYAGMDFTTRDRYRHTIEKIAKYSSLSEETVAQKALEFAKASEIVFPENMRLKHIGFYLIDKGLSQLEAVTKPELSILDRLRKAARRLTLRIYLGVLVLLTGGISFILVQRADIPGLQNTGLLAATITASVIAASQLAVSLINWFAAMLTKPDILPRMDFSEAIPDEFRSLVAVPALLTSLEIIEDMCEALEVRFLANRMNNLSFALLTDFIDAATETRPEDTTFLVQAERNITELNKKYAADGRDIFFLFHRPRKWNPQEKIWMGYERKRGKLADLNVFLRHGITSNFSSIIGNTSTLRNTKYVITLDADTQLPRDAAWQFIATMAHPLNCPYYDEAQKRITEGYGIIQPRVAVSLPGSNASLYSRLSGGEPGIDPYTRAVSDVYQDAFGEGSFIGKGIYDIDAFENALKDRFPENTILSHDLLEGCHARSGLLSNVQLYEEYPSRYSADASRRHRWIRGDWQILGWILPRVPGANGQRLKNSLSILSRWKLFDNLRRSLVPQAFLALFLLGWLALSSPGLWTVSIIGLMAIPPLCASLFDLARKSRDVSFKQHLVSSFHAAARHFAHTGFALTTLPHEAWYNSDAILRSVWRIFISRQRLLEWNPSSGESSHKPSDGLANSCQLMAASPLLAFALLVYLIITQSSATLSAGAILALWFLSPVIVWYLSRPIPPREIRLTKEQLDYLGRLSRKTWGFFEAYVGPEDNWLPPDNVQEYPVAIIAHRTSPTNMGMALQANLTAYDFGYIPLGQLVTRTENTLNAMAHMERHQGHFYNWYDTQSLKPLNPLYVSSVDSGNLIGHLLTLRQGFLEIADQPMISPRLFQGLNDTFGILVDVAGKSTPTLLEPFEKYLHEACHEPPITFAAIKDLLEHMVASASQFSDTPDTSMQESDISWWAKALVRQCREALDEIDHFTTWSKETIPTLHDLAAFEPTREYALSYIRRLEELAELAQDMAQINYDFLYDKGNHLLAIGYNVTDRRRDASYYDLLASEARLACFVGIAQGKIPQESWFALGRQLTNVGGEQVLLSWSGSMFEYLMPLLIMPNFDKTLLDQTHKATVRSQIAYSAQHGLPWGVSESSYYMFDAHLNYQYRAFGVPGLGIKRGLADDLVVAPYASMMALMVFPEEACANLQHLSAEGFEGRFGLYEAIDYTASRLPRGKTHTVIKSFMAHHQGMGLLSLSYLLLDKPMPRRFAANPLFQATMLLLHERIPKATAHYSNTTELSVIRTTASTTSETRIRILTTPNTIIPEVHLLSNGRYHVMTTSAGGSYSRWKDLAVTRWREDGTRDHWGTFCYIRDVATGNFWSTSYQPTLKPSSNYEVIFSESRAEFRRRDNDIDIHTEIVVSPEDDIELRRMRITNRRRTRRVIEVTSYAEVVLAPAAADVSHPAFSNLFVQTEILEKEKAILCTRRARSVNEQPPWMFHMMSVHGARINQTSYETDRSKFVGRGHTTTAPHAMTSIDPLSGSQGPVLDPIVAIRHRIVLEPEQVTTVDLVMGAAETRETCVNMINKYQDNHLADRVFELAWTHSQIILRQLNASEADAQRYSQLANSIIYQNASLRADPAVLIRNRRSQSGLWGYAISGDLPIVLLRIKDIDHIDLVRQLVQAHAYWRLKGLAVDLVIWNEDPSGYRQVLQDHIMGLIAAGIEAHVIDRPGGIFVRPGDQIAPEDRILLESVARIVISDSNGTLAENISRALIKPARPPRLLPLQGFAERRDKSIALPEHERVLFNGLGGFTPSGHEYIITIKSGQETPAPWSNVIANDKFGTVISESGQSYTWGENAHEFRLTPWNNDPISDPSGEAFYIRDEETGHFWSPMPKPMHSASPYTTRHGFGYSVFEHVEDGIYSELWVYVAIDSPIKFSVLKIRNESGRPRKLSATGYVEWVMGDIRSKTAMHVITQIDPATGAILARNAYNTDFAQRTAFFTVDDKARSVTGDRREFIGRNGSLAHPAAMERKHLSGSVGAGFDPCAAIQVLFELAPGQQHEVAFKLGVADGIQEHASSIIHYFKGSLAVQTALESVNLYWRETLGAVQVKTPDVSLNILTNGWLMYQTIACRLWARSGYYQSGGAFGFRDQLQDTMALIHTKPLLMRNQLLLCAAHQFVEGDVQHWWHPPSGRGVRTKCSDDYLWLPLATHRYVTATGDTGVLEEIVPFIEGRILNQEEDSCYDMPMHSAEKASLYEHCVRAIKRVRYGERGLPLIGSCDWNDGMDKVGEHGKGESVWLGFFLYDILIRFATISNLREDTDFAASCRAQAEQLQLNIEKNGWDGAWYRRAYFDDGTPLGSIRNEECKIDSLSQSWAVLSRAANPDRARMAMEAVNERLVQRDFNLVQLLDPPFNKAEPNPGYIRGYVPGVRENGGQYTHAAIWMAMAFASLGDRERSYELLQMINPLNHARNLKEASLYKVEPYVIAADVYGIAPHTGRGGWTWYTGSSGWLYRLILESILGVTREGNMLGLTPCLPKGWTTFELDYVYRNTVYNIIVSQISSDTARTIITIDDVIQDCSVICLVDDEKAHNVHVAIYSTL